MGAMLKETEILEHNATIDIKEKPQKDVKVEIQELIKREIILSRVYCLF